MSAGIIVMGQEAKEKILNLKSLVPLIEAASASNVSMIDS